MKNVILLLIMFLLFSNACNMQDQTERIKIQTDSVVDSLYTSLPGKILIHENYIILMNPFNRDGFITVYDRQNGTEIKTLGTIGKGPNECIQPHIGNLYQSQLLIYDIGLNKYSDIYIDSLLHSKKNPIFLKKCIIPGTSTLIKIDDDRFIASDFYYDERTGPFKLTDHLKVITSFGKNPVENGVNEFLPGGILYHPAKGIFLYAAGRTPYVAAYKREGDSFVLKWETQIKKPDYDIRNGQIEWGINHPSGIDHMTFCKDYIVCISNDLKQSEIKGREVSTAPKTIYLLSYDGKLIKILDMPRPLIRVASDIDSNIVYTVELEPDYHIAKFNLADYGL